ncbi:hypothetical protein J2Z79_001958 [Symbiobacterium terraclitae]|uniref:Carbohydrate-binding domain-containing protein n=1 Tax=Symbiobacterium terraclitae TaxID=557451 RepID=A0ABS4JSR7_9FIRM|nr:sugar-binding protein [Symbiobacterium terraclitae]MBP2018543.1 hypothetical protein [Symbiobacterium terraclitae]
MRRTLRWALRRTGLPLHGSPPLRRVLAAGLVLLIFILAGCTSSPGPAPGPVPERVDIDPPWGPEAVERPMRSGLINLTHLNSLVEPMEVEGRELSLVHIYAEAPSYGWVDASDEGIACVDDVARAVIVYLNYYRDTEDPAALAQARRLLNFVLYMQAEDGEYYNFVTDNRGTINRTGQTSYKAWSWWAARGQWALAEGYALFRELDPEYAAQLREAYLRGEEALKASLTGYGRWDELHGARVPAWLLGGGSDLTALALYGLAAWYEAEPNDQTRALMEQLGEAVAAYQLGSFAEYPFGAQPSNAASTALWHAWGSHQVMALARAGRLLGRGDFIAAARQAADSFFTYLLVTDLVNEAAVSFRRQGQIAYGASMLVHGFDELYRATGRAEYARYAGLAGSWFFGNNIAGVAMYDPGTGRGYDGINGANPFMVNRNAGAESTVEALLSLQRIVREPEAARYLEYREVGRSYAAVVEVESGQPVSGSPEYGRRDWTGEATFSGGRYYALAPGDAVELELPVAEAGEYHLYLAHERQAAPKDAGANTVHAVRAPGPVHIDGILDDAEWAGAPAHAVERQEQLLRGRSTWPGAEADSFRFRLMWDDENLYIGAEVRDPEHWQQSVGPGVWQGDALWVYLDTAGGGSRVDVKLTFAQTPQGPQVWDWRGGGFLPGARLAFRQLDGGYVYEAALPLAALGRLDALPDRAVQAATGAVWVAGIDVGRGATGGGFMCWTGLDPDAAENHAPLAFVAEPPARQDVVAPASQGPADVAVTVEVGEHAPLVLHEAVSPDRDYLWLDRLTGLPLRLEPGVYRVRITGSGADPARRSVVDALWLVPSRQRKVLAGPDGRQLELIRHWNAGFTEWKE